MLVNTQTSADTPQTDTPVAVETTTTNQDDEILKDFGIETPTETPAAGEAPATKEDEVAPDAELTEADKIRYRADYLKKANAIAEQRKQLDEREAKLREQEEALAGGRKTEEPDEKKGAPDPDDEALTEAYLYCDDLDPSEFGAGNEFALASRLKVMGQMFKQVVAELREQRTVTSQVQQNETEVRAQILHRMVTTGAESISQKYGLQVTDDEVAASLGKYGKSLAEQNGGKLPPDAAVRAWVLDNWDVINAKGEAVKPAATTPVTSPASLNTGSAPTGAGTPSDDDEAIARDFGF